MTEEEQVKEIKLDLTTQAQNYQIRISKCNKIMDLVKEMVAVDHEAAKRDALVKEAGYQIFDRHE